MFPCEGPGLQLGDVKLRSRGHHRALALAVQKRAARLGHVVDEDTTHALCVLSGGGDCEAGQAEH